MSKLYLYGYSMRSLGSKNLSQALGIKRISHTNSRFVGSPSTKVIIWGNPDILPEEVQKCRLLNPPTVTKVCVNKLYFFKKLEGTEARIPKFSTDPEEALKWAAEGTMVVGRQKLEGMSGEGIVFLQEDGDLNANFLTSKMFVQYIKKESEFRVHIINGRIVDVQKKVLRKYDQNGQPIDPSTVDFRVRNLANGFIFQRNNIDVPQDVYTQAQNAYHASGLDFGAFDVIYNAASKKAYVLEANTAPGLEGTTVENYAAAFREYMNGT